MKEEEEKCLIRRVLLGRQVGVTRRQAGKRNKIDTH